MSPYMRISRVKHQTHTCDIERQILPKDVLSCVCMVTKNNHTSITHAEENERVSYLCFSSVLQQMPEVFHVSRIHSLLLSRLHCHAAPSKKLTTMVFAGSSLHFLTCRTRLLPPPPSLGRCHWSSWKVPPSISISFCKIKEPRIVAARIL